MSPYPQRRGTSRGTSVRLTGLFKTKRPNLFIGTMADIKPLIQKLKDASAAGKGLTFFLWKNDPGKGPVLSLSVDLEQDRQQAPVRQAVRKPIEDDPFEAEGDSDPFANG